MKESYCPKCFGELVEFRRGDIVTLRCARCHGHWVDQLAIGNALERTGAPGESRSVQSLLASIMGEETDLGCPRCEDARLRRSYLERIEIEFCADCRGVFLDPGELRRLNGVHQERPRTDAHKASAGATGEWDPLVEGLFFVAEILFS